MSIACDGQHLNPLEMDNNTSTFLKLTLSQCDKSGVLQKGCNNVYVVTKPTKTSNEY